MDGEADADAWQGIHMRISRYDGTGVMVDMSRSLLGTIYYFEIQPSLNPANASWIGYGEKHHLHEIGDKWEKGYSLTVTSRVENTYMACTLKLLDPIQPISRILRDNFKFGCLPARPDKGQFTLEGDWILDAHLNDDDPTDTGAKKLLDDVISFISNYPFWFKFEHLEKLKILDHDDVLRRHVAKSLGHPQYDKKISGSNWESGATVPFPKILSWIEFIEKVCQQLLIVKILINRTPINSDVTDKPLRELCLNGTKINGHLWQSMDRMFRQANVTSAKEVLKFYQNQEEEIYCVLRACTPSEFLDRFHKSLAEQFYWMVRRSSI